MRLPLFLSAALLLAACGRGSPQADALDNAAAQADPAAAVAMRNAADRIREDGGNAALADPHGAAQQAMAGAGRAAATGAEPTAKPAFGTRELVTAGPVPATPAGSGADARGASPHRAGDPVPNTAAPTPVVHHY